MNTITIFGIVLIKKTNEDIKVAIKTAKNGTSQQEQLTQIKNSFQDWAEKFTSKKELLIDKQTFENQSIIADKKSKRLNISEKFIPYVEMMIEDISEAVNAYNLLNENHKLLIEKKEIPTDIFYDTNEFYFLQLSMNGKNINLFNCGEFDLSENPAFVINHDQVSFEKIDYYISPSKHFMENDYLLEFNVNNNSFIFQSKNDPYKLGNILSKGKLDKFNHFSENLSKKLIERVVVIFSAKF